MRRCYTCRDLRVVALLFIGHIDVQEVPILHRALIQAVAGLVHLAKLVKLAKSAAPSVDLDAAKRPPFNATRKF
eukprot:scaffold91_cov254-Pinguiococcus_pyrenoidosus.AAC.11